MRPINLVPQRDRGAANARKVIAAVVVIGIAYLVGLAALTMLWNDKVDTAEQRLADQQVVNESLQSQILTLAAADVLRLEYEENALLTAVILSTDVAWGRLLNDFGRLIPERVWLENFVGTTTPGIIPGVVGRITVTGTGFEFSDVSAWLRSLDESRFPGVAGTWVTNASEGQGVDEGSSAISFNSTAGLTGAAVSNRVQDRVPEVSG